MRQQFRYTLFLLSLTLLGFISLGYSQETVEQPNEEPTPAEQPTEEPNPLETQPENLEKQLPSDSQREFRDIKTRLESLENPPPNQPQTVVIISLVLAIFAFVLATFFGSWMILRQGKFNKKIQGLISVLNQKLARRLDSVQNVNDNNANRLEKMISVQSTIHNMKENVEQTNDRINNIDATLADMRSDMEMGAETEDALIDYQEESERIVRNAQERVEELARAYTDGEPIDCIEIEPSTPSQKVHLIAQILRQWKIESEKSGPADLVRSLTQREKTITDELKTIRGEPSLSSKPLVLETDISTDTELNDIRNQCIDYVARFEGMLSGYDLGHQVDETIYEEFIPRFIKIDLINNVAKFIPSDLLPEKMDRFLQFIDWEIIPIEIGKTEADARWHTIQGSQQTGVESGTVAQVVLPGLRRKIDGEIVQRPVVIRAE